MEYKITMVVEDKDGLPIFKMSTDAGMKDFEENIIRKGENAIKENDEMIEYNKTHSKCCDAEIKMGRCSECLEGV